MLISPDYLHKRKSNSGNERHPDKVDTTQSVVKGVPKWNLGTREREKGTTQNVVKGVPKWNLGTRDKSPLSKNLGLCKYLIPIDFIQLVQLWYRIPSHRQENPH
jgi:hypothetical protein